MSTKPTAPMACSAGGGFYRWGGGLIAIGAIGLGALTLGWPSQAENVAYEADVAAETAADTTPAAIMVPANQDHAKSAEPVWQDDFDTALAAARSAKKPLLLRFTASWCVPCQVMDAAAWPDDQVQSLLAEKVIAMEVDVDREANRALLRRYRVTGVPTLLLLNPQGEETARSGFQSAEALREFLKGA